ncbi:MAG TPA: hypothetical protein VG710_14785 [Opitutus sp.]|nr:hypothetical protein [Opitutus sp.]
MSRVPVIFCLIALLGAATSTILFFRTSGAKRILQADLHAAGSHAAVLESRLAAATAKNESLEKQMLALDADRGAAKSRLTVSEAHNVLLARDLAQANAALAAQDETVLALKTQIESLRHDLADAHANSIPADAARSYKATIADLERQLADARHGAAVTAVAGASTAAFSIRSSAVEPAPQPVVAPPARSVLSVGPSNAFVVLDYGAHHGAEIGQSLAIQRSGSTVATVSISDVRPNFCIAQVSPDSLHGALQKGDSAVLTN